MRILVLGVVGLLVLGGGGAGAYFFFAGHEAEASVGETAEHQDAKEAKKEAKTDEKGEHAQPTSTFVQLDPLILPVIDETGLSQTVSIVVALEVADDPTGMQVRKLAPRLKDAYIQDMYGIMNKRAALQGGVVQVGMIKERLNAITKRVLGDDMVKDVLLQVVQQRPI